MPSVERPNPESSLGIGRPARRGISTGTPPTRRRSETTPIRRGDAFELSRAGMRPVPPDFHGSTGRCVACTGRTSQADRCELLSPRPGRRDAQGSSRWTTHGYCRQERVPRGRSPRRASSRLSPGSDSRTPRGVRPTNQRRNGEAIRQ